MSVWYLKTIRILNGDPNDKKIINFKRLHIPLTLKQANKLISKLNKKYIGQYKRVYLDLSEQK